MGFVYFSNAERNIFLILDHDDDDDDGDADEEQEGEHEEFERTQTSHQNDMQKTKFIANGVSGIEIVCF